MTSVLVYAVVLQTLFCESRQVMTRYNRRFELGCFLTSIVLEIDVVTKFVIIAELFESLKNLVHFSYTTVT